MHVWHVLCRQHSLNVFNLCQEFFEANANTRISQHTYSNIFRENNSHTRIAYENVELQTNNPVQWMNIYLFPLARDAADKVIIIFCTRKHNLYIGTLTNQNYIRFKLTQNTIHTTPSHCDIILIGDFFPNYIIFRLNNSYSMVVWPVPLFGMWKQYWNMAYAECCVKNFSYTYILTDWRRTNYGAAERIDDASCSRLGWAPCHRSYWWIWWTCIARRLCMRALLATAAIYAEWMHSMLNTEHRYDVIGFQC